MRITALVTLHQRNDAGEKVTRPPGSVVDLPDDEARVLIGRRLARPAAAEQDAAPRSSQENTAAATGPAVTPLPPKPDRMAAIQAALEKLDPATPGHFTSKGKPDTKAIEAITGFEVTAAERDTAWNSMEEVKG